MIDARSLALLDILERRSGWLRVGITTYRRGCRGRSKLRNPTPGRTRSTNLHTALSRGYLVPSRDDPAHKRLMGEWATRYRVRLAAAQWLIDAVGTIETEEPACPSSP